MAHRGYREAKVPPALNPALDHMDHKHKGNQLTHSKYPNFRRIQNKMRVQCLRAHSTQVCRTEKVQDSTLRGDRQSSGVQSPVCTTGRRTDELSAFSSGNLTHSSHSPLWEGFFHLCAPSYPEITEKYLCGIVTEEKKTALIFHFCSLPKIAGRLLYS